MFTKLFILSILCHIIDDFVLQPVCLSKLKQKSFWEKEAPDPLYKDDYRVALLIHCLSWSIMIMLPYIFWMNANDLIYGIMLIVNTLIHYFVDDAKANKHKLNLWHDQMIHIIQVIITYYVFIYFI